MNKNFTEMNNANKFYQININIGLGILLFITLFSLIILPESNIFKESYEQMGHGHDLPPSTIGDR